MLSAFATVAETCCRNSKHKRTFRSSAILPENKRILVSGGTGSLGQELATLLSETNEVVVYSRNEERQYEMKQQFPEAAIEYVIGDVRDRGTLKRALRGCQIAIHAAAMKDLIFCEAQPTQAYLNNIEGSLQFIEACLESDVEKAIGASTDKAASPSNVYGCTKYIMEQLFTEAGTSCGKAFSSVRFGNMIDSTGSLISHWKEHPEKDIKITHPEVARFFFTRRDGAMAVVEALENNRNGDIFIKKMKKAKIVDILRIITGRREFETIGLFPGEKLHEDLLSENEVRSCFEFDDHYIIRRGQINPRPPTVFSTENAESFSEDELRALIYPQV